MATLYKLSQFFITTLNVGGGINNSQTTGIAIASSSGIDDVNDPGIALISYSDPLNTSNAEWITYTSISGNVFQGVTRGAEGFNAKAHDNGVQVAFPLSKSNVNNLAEALAIGGVLTNGVTGTLDEDDMASNSAVKLATQQSIKAYVDNNSTPTTGWITPNETWTRTGNFTFTVPTDLTTKYRKGTKIRYKDGGSFEYGYVKSSAYSAPDTTVTLVTNADYTMAAATITEPGFSYQASPQGFPDWFSFTTTWTGFSADPASSTLYFRIDGTTLFFYLPDGANGTSNATSLTFTIPVSSRRQHNMFAMIGAVDNGSASSTPGHLVINSSAAIVQAYKSFSQTAWTNSGGKNIFLPTLTLEWT